ncbi:MAG: acyltransferase [Verrucomicrobiia bacterium]
MVPSQTEASLGVIPRSRYQPQLDGLRAVAVLVILLDHNYTPVAEFLHLGLLGVRLFFVMSGYLITHTLLGLRKKIDARSLPLTGAFTDFYARRFLRILPAYYVAIALGVILGFPQVQGSLIWPLTFLTNFWISLRGEWPPMVSHFWSIAVQEQFYLLWPCIILIVSRTYLWATMIGFVLSALIFRVICITWEIPLITRWVLPFGCLDSLVIGAMISYAKQTWQPIRYHFWIKSKGAIAVAIICIATAHFLRGGDPETPLIAVKETLEALALACFLAHAVEGFSGWFGKCLSNPILVSMGRMSYGIYLYHVLILAGLKPFLTPLLSGLPQYEWIQALILCFATWSVAALSWYGLENPISQLRKYFITTTDKNSKKL